MAGQTPDDLAASVMAAMADPVAVVGPASELIWANRAAVARMGWSIEEWRGSPLIELVHPDDHETAIFSLASVVNKEVGSLIEIRIRDRSEQYSWFEIRGRAWDHPDHPGAVVLNVRESTDRHRWQLGAGNHEELSAILDAAPTISMVLDATGTIRGANRAVTRLLHRSIESTLGTSVFDLVAPEDLASLQGQLGVLTGTGGTVHLEARFLTGRGEQVPLSLTVVDMLADRVVQGLVVAASDISALIDARSELRHLATHDELTGLPNRANLRERLQRLLDGPAEAGGGVTLLFADVDALKSVNDRYGHRAGDAVLAEVAARLRSVTRSDDLVARLSGDEFVMVITSTDPGVVDGVQDRIAEAIARPFELPDGTRVALSISTGVAAAEPGLTAEDLLAAADAAMYVAKRQRGGA